MSAILDRIEQIKKGSLPQRLGVGAGHLGRMWKEGVRCKSAWKATCACGLDQNSFCRTKLKWVGLLVELYGIFPDGLTGAEEYFVIEAMTLSMVKASGLVVLVEVPGARKPIKMGGALENWNLLNELGEMDPDDVPGFLEAVVLMQEKL